MIRGVPPFLRNHQKRFEGFMHLIWGVHAVSGQSIFACAMVEIYVDQSPVARMSTHSNPDPTGTTSTDGWGTVLVKPLLYVWPSPWRTCWRTSSKAALHKGWPFRNPGTWNSLGIIRSGCKQPPPPSIHRRDGPPNSWTSGWSWHVNSQGYRFLTHSHV